jgi:two-component system, OmpR family, phosphate regulon sensor histidine kinase PhoR
MKTPSPRQISVLTSLIVAITGFLFFLSVNFIFKLDVPIGYLLAYPFVAFLTSFLFYFYTLEKFIHSKIKTIYKTIGQPKRFFKELKDDRNRIVSSVERDVAEWAINKNKQIRELRKLETYRKEFVGNVSHELKTPIFNAQGYLQTLVEDGIDDKEFAQKYIERALSNIDRLETIVKDLEEISKYEAGQMILEYSSFDIIDLIYDVIEELKYQASDNNVRISVIPPSFKTIVWADKNRIHQVVVNLISNSIKYGHTGDGGSTTVNFYDLEQQLLVEISDNGPGIEEKDLPRVFERFFRADKSRTRKSGGTGLGLAIVKNIVESHNQNISVSSVVNEGTAFSFTLEKYILK